MIVIRKFNTFVITTPVLELFYGATNAAASVGTSTISARVYANTHAFNNLANTYDWYIAAGQNVYTYSSLSWYYSSGVTNSTPIWYPT